MSATNPLYDEELRCRHCAYQGTKCKRANNTTVNLVSDCAHLHRGSYQGICSDFAPNPNYPFYFKNWTSFQDYFDHAAPDIPRPNLADQTAAAVFCFNGDRSTLYFVSQNDFIFGNLYQDGKLRTVYRQVKTKNIHSSSGYSYPTEACDFTPLPQGAAVPPEAICTTQPAYPPLIYTPPLTPEQDCPYPYDETFTPKVWEGNDFMPPPTVCPWGPNVHRWLSYFGEGYTSAKDDSPLDLYCSPYAGIRLQVTGPYFYLTETHPGTELLFTNNESHRNFLAQACTLAHRDMSRDRALQILSRTKPDCKLWQILRTHCLPLAQSAYDFTQ